MAVHNKGYTYTHLSPIFRIKSNVRLPYELEEEDAPSTPRSGEVEITFNVANDLPVPSFGYPYNFEHCFFGEWDADEIYFEPTIGCPIKAKMQVKGLLSKNIEVLVNKTYYRLFKRKIGGVEPPGKQLGHIMTVKLLERNLALMHGAAICSDGDGIVIIAPTNTGKTLTSVLGIQRGFGFIAEDTSATDGEKVYSMNRGASPSFFHFLEPQRKKPVLQIKIIDLVNNKLPFLSYIMKLPTFSRFSLDVPLTKEAKIKCLFFLSRGRKGVVELDKQEAIRRILVLNRFEFNYYGNKVLLAYSYLNPALDLTRLVETEEKVLARLIDNHPCFLCTAEDPRQYIELIEQQI